MKLNFFRRTIAFLFKLLVALATKYATSTFNCEPREEADDRADGVIEGELIAQAHTLRLGVRGRISSVCARLGERGTLERDVIGLSRATCLFQTPSDRQTVARGRH